jgi:hypothetical protein
VEGAAGLASTPVPDLASVPVAGADGRVGAVAVSPAAPAGPAEGTSAEGGVAATAGPLAAGVAAGVKVAWGVAACRSAGTAARLPISVEKRRSSLSGGSLPLDDWLDCTVIAACPLLSRWLLPLRVAVTLGGQPREPGLDG